MQPDNNLYDRELTRQEKEIDDLFADEYPIIEKIADVNVDKALKKFFHRKQSYRLRAATLNTLKYAAAVVLLLLTGYYVASYKINRQNQDIYTVFNIPNSEMGNVVLPDGTKVELNSSSELRYPLRFLNSREVFLTGEAFFDVKSDAGNPFLVHVDDFTIKVTGTRFNIKAYPDTNPEATLEEGKITVINHEGNSIAELKPNENLVYDKIQKRILVTTVNTEQKTGWREGKIFLKNQTLEEISKIIERWYPIRVVFDDESVKQVRLTGTILKDKPIEELLNALVKSNSINFKLITESNGKNIVHIKQGKME